MEICDTAFDSLVPGGEQCAQFPVLWSITSNATIKTLFESPFVRMLLDFGSVRGGHKTICFGVVLISVYNLVNNSSFIYHL